MLKEEYKKKRRRGKKTKPKYKVHASEGACPFPISFIIMKVMYNTYLISDFTVTGGVIYTKIN